MAQKDDAEVAPGHARVAVGGDAVVQDHGDRALSLLKK